MDEKYIAGLVSQSFWFVEFKKMLKLIADGKDRTEISKLCIKENIFGIANQYRAKRICQYIYKRASRLDARLRELFFASDLQTQKIINLIAILLGDRLFFDFLYEVYREKHILGAVKLEDADVAIFFNTKEVQSKEVVKFTDATKKRLRSIYFNFMTDANLLTLVGKERTITPPIVDSALEQYFQDSGKSSIFKAITGVN